MGNQMKTTLYTNLLATVALAKIQADGLWTGHDVAVSDGIGVENGLAYGIGDYARMLTSAQMEPGDMSDYMSKDNVQLVASFVTQEKWDFYFPDIHNAVCTGSKYSYEGFLKAIAKYPALCGENNRSTSDLDTCKREIAGMFAHVVQETGNNSPWENNNGTPYWRQGQCAMEENGCATGQPGHGTAACAYTVQEAWADVVYPPKAGE